MLLCLLACTAALQSDILDLEDPSGDSDVVVSSAVAVTPNGRFVVVPHLAGPTTLVPLGQGTTVSASVEPSIPSDTIVTPDGSTALVLDRWISSVRFFALPSMSVLAEVTLPFSSYRSLDLDSTGTRAVASYPCAVSHTVAILDVGTRTVERTFSPPGTFVECNGGFKFAADDVTLVAARQNAIVGFDATTGLLIGSTPLATGGSRAKACLLPSNRRVAHVVTQRGGQGPNPTVWLETFDLPSLVRVSVVPLARGTTYGTGRDCAAIDDAGMRLLLNTTTSVYVVDLLSSVVTELLNTGEQSCCIAMSRDGTRAYVRHGAAATIYDLATAVAMGEVPMQALAGGPVRHGPPGQRFLIGTRERLLLLDASQSPIRIEKDISTGAGHEMDGPFSFELMHDGRRAVVTARESDDLRVIDLDQRVLMQRVALARGPVDVARLDTGDLIVAHMESERVSIIDTQAWTLRGEVLLPAPATQVEAVPGTTLAWVHVEGPQIRALLLIETIAGGSIVGAIQLPGHANLPDTFESVKFDHARRRALVLDAAAGDITLVSLASQSVVHSAFFRPAPFVRMSLSSAGDRVVVASSTHAVTAFDVGTTRLSAAWIHSCIPATPSAESFAPLVELDDGRVLYVDFPGWSGSCRGPKLIRMSDGVSIAPNGHLLPPDLNTFASGSEVIDDGGSTPHVQQRRFVGDALPYTTSIFSAIDRFSEAPIRDPSSLVTFVPGSRLASFSHVPVLAFLDFVTPNATQACAPSVPNSIGNDATLSFAGGGLAGEPLVVTVSGLRPGSMPSMLLVADAVAAPVLVPGGIGSICLGGRIGRFVHQVQLADASGRASVRVETSALPLATGSTAALPGDSWTFQSWYRDTNSPGTPASHFSEAVTLVLQ